MNIEYDTPVKMADVSNRESGGLQTQSVKPTMQQETKTALDGADAVEKGQEPSVNVNTATQGAGELMRLPSVLPYDTQILEHDPRKRKAVAPPFFGTCTNT